MKEILCFLTYEHLYGKNNDDKTTLIKNCLSKLNREEALKKCSVINFELFINQNCNDLQTRLIKANFNQTGIKKLKQATTTLNKSLSELVIFYRGQIINLIWYILKYCQTKDGLKIKDGEEFNKIFIKSTLIVSQFIYERVHQGKWRNTDDLKEDSKTALPAIRKSIEYSNHIDIESKKYFQLFHRGFFIFVETFSETFKKKFNDKLKIDLKTFYLIIITFIYDLLILKNQNIFDHKTIGNSTKKPNAIRNLVAELSCTPEELTKEIEKNTSVKSDSETITAMEKILRNKPFLRINDNETIIIDPTNLIEFATIGPLFQLTEPGKQDVFNHYEECFELYVQSHLERICDENKKLSKNVQLKRTTKKEGALETDSYIEINDKVILTEIKSSFINNSEDLFKELDKKYFEKKGVQQFVKRIKLLNDKNVGYKEIFPLLIVQDSLLDNTEFLFNEKLKNSGNAFEDTGINIKLHPLTIMSIDMLERLPNDIDLNQLLIDYLNYINNQPTTINSLSEFIIDSKYGRNLCISDPTIEKVKTIINESKQLLFSKTAH